MRSRVKGAETGVSPDGGFGQSVFRTQKLQSHNCLFLQYFLFAHVEFECIVSAPCAYTLFDCTNLFMLAHQLEKTKVCVNEGCSIMMECSTVLSVSRRVTGRWLI